ncbi:MAG: inositol-1-monophosphatase [Gammaproteobacteria bacterium]
MHPMLNIAIRAARKAGDIIVRSLSRVEQLKIDQKDRNDFVTEVDRKAEEEIIYVIRKAYPDHAILAEESGSHEGNEFEWIIDPLDGTTNFLHGFPQFSVSIALRQKGRLEQAVVYDPMRQELFTATRGGGAFLDDRRIRVSQRRSLEGALLGTGFPYRDQTHMDTYLEMFKALAKNAAGIRRPGSAALDLSYVAAGRLDGFWELDLNIWDMAAGVLLIREAGGLVGDLAGGHDFLESGNIVAATPKLFPHILKEIHPFQSKI